MSSQQIKDLRQIVVGFVVTTETYLQKYYPHQKPALSSTAGTEIERSQDSLAGDWSRRPVDLAYGMAQLHIRTSQDHVMGLERLLAPLPLEDSIYTVARGAVEAAARATWLLDMQIDARTRVARAMTERLHGIADRWTVGARLGEDVADLADQKSTIIRTAEALGFTVTPAKGHRAPSLVPYPSKTQLVQLIFGSVGPLAGVAAYSDLSAVAHSSLAAFATQEPAGNMLLGDQASSRPDRIPIERGVVLALRAYETAVTHFFTSYGWNTGPWLAFTTEAYAELRAIFDLRRSMRSPGNPIR